MVWVARDHLNNYPKFLVDILDPIPNVVLYDTTKMPRPNLCTMTVDKAREFNAEAVFIVSNPKMAYHVSNYVIKQGIPVFATVHPNTNPCPAETPGLRNDLLIALVHFWA